MVNGSIIIGQTWISLYDIYYVNNEFVQLVRGLGLLSKWQGGLGHLRKCQGLGPLLCIKKNLLVREEFTLYVPQIS